MWCRKFCVLIDNVKWFRVFCDLLYFPNINLLGLFHTRRWTCLTWGRATAPSRRACPGSSVPSWSLVYRQTYCSPSGNRGHLLNCYRSQVINHSIKHWILHSIFKDSILIDLYIVCYYMYANTKPLLCMNGSTSKT